MLAYEELKGSSGREIWFRPMRYDARKLFPNNAPRVRVKTGSYQLHDISLTGIAVVAKQSVEDELELGEVVPVAFQQGGLSIFESKAKVRRTENTVFGSKVAFSFEDSYVDFDRLLSRNVQAQIAANGNFIGGPRSALVPSEYRAFCSDVLGLLRSYRALLDQNINLADQFSHAFDDVGAYEARRAPIFGQHLVEHQGQQRCPHQQHARPRGKDFRARRQNARGPVQSSVELHLLQRLVAATEPRM